MGSLTLTGKDILCISVSTNVCFLLHVVSTRLVKWLLPLLSKRKSVWRTLFAVHQRWPDLLGRLLMEQLSLTVIIILILVKMGFKSTSIAPFQEHGPETYQDLTQMILSACAGRFAFIFISIVHNTEMTFRTRRNSRSSISQLVYCSVGVATNIFGLGYKQNLLLLSTAPFMELSSAVLAVCHLIKLAERLDCRSYLKSAILCCAVCLLSRFLLPVLFLCHALSQESPFVMDIFPTCWFFISGGIYAIFHSIFLYMSIKRIRKASKILFDGETNCCSATSANADTNTRYPVSNGNNWLINDIFNEFDEDDDFNSTNVHHSTTTVIRNLSYGFLPSYDNRNLYHQLNNSQEEKMNILQKKNSSKQEFVCKFDFKIECKKDLDAKSFSKPSYLVEGEGSNDSINDVSGGINVDDGEGSSIINNLDKEDDALNKCVVAGDVIT